MSRTRVRRSFTVEVRNSGLPGAHKAIPNRSPKLARDARPAGSLLGRTDPWTPVALPAGAIKSSTIGRRRVLPSLLVSAPIESESPPAPAKPRRVRRTKQPQCPAPAHQKPCNEPLDARALAVSVQPPILLQATAARRATRDPKATQTLPPGQRWKRRLPRACW